MFSCISFHGVGQISANFTRGNMAVREDAKRMSWVAPCMTKTIQVPDLLSSHWTVLRVRVDDDQDLSCETILNCVPRTPVIHKL